MMYQRGLDGALDGINAEELRESVVQLRESPPVFDHCSFDALVGDHPSDGGKSTDIDSHRINKQWMGPRVDPGGAVRAFSSSTASFGGERVAVLGAGVSGLQSVRALRAKGFDVTAYDPNPSVGGLWRQNYLSYGVQVPKQLYEFPDLEFSEVEVGQFPSGAE
eukprot:scaffold3179_cov106-Skeletonema_marinoi.AAC.1